MGIRAQLNARRRELGWTQGTAAAEARLGRQVVNEIENLAADPKLSTIRRLAAAYGCEIVLRRVRD